MVFVLFFLSGACALIYEVAWTCALKLEFGSTTLAVSTVLSVFMGGLAIGAHLAGKRADRLSKPLFSYGIIEVFLAIHSLSTPLMFHWFLPLFGIIGTRFSENFLLVSIWRLLISVIFLLPATVLMSATLPVLSRFYAWNKKDAGRGAGLLYGVNTTGAFLGVLIAGFVMLPKLGMTVTIIVTAICNLTLGFLACLLSSMDKHPRHISDKILIEEPLEYRQSDLMVLVALALTGCTAMICEVAWTRVLTLILGASVYAFTIVLSTFLAGLGIGAWSVAFIHRISPSKARVVFYGLALSAAVSVCISSAAFRHLPPFFVRMFRMLDVQGQSEKMLWVQVSIAAIVIFIPALIMGGLFPAAVRVFVRKPQHTGQSVGMLYTYNTVGAIIGSLSAGFVLIPWIGIRNTLLLAAIAECIGGCVLFMSDCRRSNMLAMTAGGILVLMIFILTPSWDKQLMTSGMYLYGDSYTQQSAVDLSKKLKEEEEILFYRDGLTSTITVTRDRVSSNKDLYISTNGIIDGSSHYDMPTQRLSAHLPMLLHKEPENICVIGMGTGCTAGSAALYPDSRVTVVEIEEAMVEGARFFRDHNNAVHENPNVEIRITDARLFLNLHPQTFDVIISEPSNPWLAGTSDLFTRQFYQIVARALCPKGLFCQWVQLYGMSVVNLQVMIRTFASVFPYVYLASTIPETDILLLGALHPIHFDPEMIQRRMMRKEIQQDLSDPRVDIKSIYELLARIRMGPDEIRSLITSGPVHTDNLPIIAYRAPMDLYLDTRESNMQFLALHARGIGHYLTDVSNFVDKKQDFFKNLATAYRTFLPKGNESVVSEQLGSK